MSTVQSQPATTPPNQPQPRSQEAMSKLIGEWQMLFFLFVIAPLGFGIVVAIITLFQQEETNWQQFFLSSQTLWWIVPVGFALVASTCVRRIPPDMIGVYQFLGGARYYTNCLVFAPQLLTSLVFLPGSQQVFRTPENKSDKRALTVQLRQAVGLSDDQLVVLQVVFHLAIWSDPITVVRAFYEEFARSRDHGRDKVNSDVADIIIANADGPLQKYEVEVLLTDAARANADLQLDLAPRLQAIGVLLDSVAVEDVQDVRPEGGFIEQRSAAVHAELARDRRKRQAAANREASLLEQDVEREILKRRNSVIKQQVSNEGQRVKINIADLKLRLKTFRDDGWEAVRLELLKRLEDVSEQELVALASHFTEMFVQPGARAERDVFAFGGGAGGGNDMREMLLAAAVAWIKSNAPDLLKGINTPGPQTNGNANGNGATANSNGRHLVSQS